MNKKQLRILLPGKVDWNTFLPFRIHPLNCEKAAPISESILDRSINASDTTEEQVPSSERSEQEGDALAVDSNSKVPLQNHCRK